jgi:hypothetical protein
MTKLLHVTVAAAALFIWASAAMAQDARSRADSLENDTLNGVQPHGSQSRIIWRSPEIRPLVWEEQRVFDRSSQRSWMFPSDGE